MRWGERPGSGQMTEKPPSMQLLYYCAGTVNQSQVMAIAKATAEPTVATPMGILYRQPIQIEWEAADHAIVTVNYGPKPMMEGTYAISFSATVATAHTTNSLESIENYTAAGAGTARDMKGAIEFDGEEVRGCEKLVPQCKMSVAFSHPQGVFSMDRCRQLARHVTYTNTDNFFGFEPGEAIFIGFDGSTGSEQDTQIVYDYLLAENAEGLTFGDIAGVAKKGWEYLWVAYKDDVDLATGLPVRIPQAVYVDRLYEETGYVQLFGFGG